jgi:glc operon protein GlcG
MRRSSRGITVGAAILCMGATPATSALPRQPVLPLALAQRMVDACVTLATREKWKMHVAVKDAGDDLIAYARMDGSPLGSQQGAMMKASNGAAMGLLAKAAFDAKSGAPTAVAFIPGAVPMAGGLPIRAGGVLVGGIGVSGAAPQQDEACAQAGIDAIAADLK